MIYNVEKDYFPGWCCNRCSKKVPQVFVDVDGNVELQGSIKNIDDLISYTNYYAFYKVGDLTYKDVSVITHQNINFDERYGVSVSGSISLNSKFTLRSNVFAFKQRIINILNRGSVNTGYGYKMNINGTYIFNKDLAIEFFGNFRSKETNL